LEDVKKQALLIVYALKHNAKSLAESPSFTDQIINILEI
jgi:hypothetical protein